ncbi:MAG: 2-amino-4-hydroxy-6-hydroxymethyldihydropteridine diphosphokinase [Parvibaculales bacterium]
MILLGVGSNLPFGSLKPVEVVDAAIAELGRRKIRLLRKSPYYLTPPMGPAGQPDYVNAVFVVSANYRPEVLLDKLHEVEAVFGRQRRVKWGARSLDLDLLDWHGHQVPKRPELPHPGIGKRAFVLLPLHDVVPGWRHPLSRLTAREMLAKISIRDKVAPKKLS